MTSSKPGYLPKAPWPNTITLGFEVSTYELWESTNIQSITSSNTDGNLLLWKTENPHAIGSKQKNSAMEKGMDTKAIIS